MTDFTRSLTEQIRAYAYDIGYSLVGFAPADDFEEFIRIMGDTEGRYDWWTGSPREPLEWARPATKLPGTESLIVLVYDYAQKRFPSELCEKLGRVYQARCYFAQPGNINHARLELMRGFLAGQGVESADAPWMPVRWAGVRAGVSSFGKNNLAYAPRLGSFILITVLLVDAELDYSEPGPVSTCPEDCTRCIEACPTGALLKPFALEPRRCVGFNNWMAAVSYIPQDLRPLLGGRIHGCDVCQEACPRNKGVLEANRHRSADPLLELLAKELTLTKLLHLTPDYYEQRVRPVMYNYIRDTRLFQRNAAVALGNTHDAQYVPDLIEELDNASELIRAHVAWALGEIGGAEAKRALEASLVVEEDAIVRAELEQALANA